MINASDVFSVESAVITWILNPPFVLQQLWKMPTKGQSVIDGQIHALTTQRFCETQKVTD